MVNSAFAMGKGIEEATAALLTIDSKIMSQTKIVSDLAKMAQKNTQTIGDSVAFNVERELIENLEILKKFLTAIPALPTFIAVRPAATGAAPPPVNTVAPANASSSTAIEDNIPIV